jgi:hypothetical protein
MPFNGNLHINKALSNFSIKFRNTNLIAMDIIKDIPVKKESDLFYSHVRDFRYADTMRQNGAVSNQETWGVSTASYVINEHALSDIVTDRDRENADSPFQLDVETTEFLTDKILLGLEKAVHDIYFTTGSWTGNATLNTATSWFFNTTTSAPILNVLSGTSYVEKNAMVTPNMMVLGDETFIALKENQNVHERIKYVERSIITKDLLAALFDIDSVHVGKAVFANGAESGVGNTAIAESITTLWGANALLLYKNPAISRRQVTAALNFRKMNMGNPFKVKKWREEKRAGDMIEVSTMYKPRVVCSNAAYFWLSCTNQ